MTTVALADSGAAGGVAGNASGNLGSTGTQGISVELQQTPTSQATGIVAVLLPKGMASSAAGFSFPLPADIVTNLPDGASVTATQLNGAPLPSWLQFDAQTRSFVATAVPDGAIPFTVMVTVGDLKYLVVISERSATN